MFIEFKTYRWLEHCGPNWDDHLGYRPKGELNNWMKKCPLKIIEKKINSEKFLSPIRKKVDKQIVDAFKFAKKSSFTNKNILDNLYRNIEIK